MSIVEEVMSAIKSALMPELIAQREQLEAFRRETKLSLENLRNEMSLRFDGVNHRFDNLEQKLALDRRIVIIERELDEKRKAV